MRFKFIGFALVVCSVAGAGCTAQNATPGLPAPSGPFGIGRVGYDWTDTARPDRYSNAPGAHREMMVYLWYPAAKTADAKGIYLPGAKQMDADKEAQSFYREDDAPKWQLIVSGAIYSHARENAPVAKGRKFPLLVFTPGLGGPSFGYTALIEDLVSHGYAVASIEVPYNAPFVFPDGRILPRHREPMPPGLTPEEGFKRMVAMATLGITEGAGDVRFVLDKLTEMQRKKSERSSWITALDLNKAAAVGHSAGAASATRACQLDARFKACIDLDGGMVPVSALPDFGDGTKMQQPLLFLEAYHDEAHMFGTHEQHLAYFSKQESQLQQCPAGTYDVVLRAPRMVHGSFSDDGLLDPVSQADVAQALHNLDLIESYIRAFLDKTLSGNQDTLLDRNPEKVAEATVKPYGH